MSIEEATAKLLTTAEELGAATFGAAAMPDGMKPDYHGGPIRTKIDAETRCFIAAVDYYTALRAQRKVAALK